MNALQLNVLAAGLVLAPVYAQTAPDTALPDTTLYEYGSADDCAIFAVLGKAKLNWTAEVPPPGHYAPIVKTYIDNPGIGARRKRVYTSTCPWSRFGLAEPRAADATPTCTFSRPEYSDFTHASVLWQKITLTGKRGAVGLQMEGEFCNMEKRDGVWAITSCENAFKPLPARGR